MTLRWYPVHCNARREFLAAGHLRKLGLEVFLPRFIEPAPLPQVQARRKRRYIAVERAYFPRYLFVRADFGTHGEDGRDSAYAVNKTVGVSTLVYGPEGPLYVPDRVIEEIMARQDKRGYIPMTAEQRHAWAQIGAELEVAEGAFAHFLGTVSRVDGNRLTALMDVFGGKVEVEMPIDWARAVEKEKA